MKASPYAVLLLLLTICFSVATGLELRELRAPARAQETEGGLAERIMGDSKRMFANELFTRADVYFHSGYYPSIFDRNEKPKATAMTSQRDAHGDEHGHDDHDHDAHDHSQETPEEHAAHAGHDEPAGHDHEHEKEFSFLGEPRDWIERFGRRFKVTEHKHLAGGNEREILPWLRMAAEMDPHMIQTYTASAYWLRKELKQPTEAETFLREGLQNNPGNYEILFELGGLYFDDYHDPNRARNVWLAALRSWDKQKVEDKAKSMDAYEKLTVNIGHLEDLAGNWLTAVQYFELAKVVSPNPEALQKQIDEVQAKFAPNTPSTAPPPL